MRGVALLGLVGVAMISLQAGCLSTSSDAVSPHKFTSVAQVRAALKFGPAKLKSVSSQLALVRREFEEFSQEKKSGWTARGYMNARESERMEFMLFRFVSAQDVLSDMVGSLGGKHSEPLFPDKSTSAAAHVLVTDAQFLLVHHRAELVAQFASDPVAIAKLNEAFYRFEIPKGSYRKMHLSVTKPDVPRRLQAAWDLFEQETTSDGGSLVGNLQVIDQEYSALVGRVPEDRQRAMASLAKVQGKRLSEDLDHSEAAALARATEGEASDVAYEARKLLFKNVSRIKNPAVKVITFSDEQHAQVKRLLQPGDIILTYTAGYMSDVFIPGSFKHGITYIGSPAQRKAVGLNGARYNQATLSNGRDVDVIEAVAEGVIFNNLGYLMDTHVNRMAVLRPKLSERDRVAFLAEVFSYHGDAYDFLFDFADASKQVCTEVIWRGINGREGIDMALTKRGGHPTLSADDLVNYHFDSGGKHFEFVLFAETAGSDRRAVIHTGSQGEERLRLQMKK
ncbi:YiiX/YebB-like N1pC/P60 family cysteine hydrolase [Haloferula chungangensis]|uniref:YiiX/YebB-like N1pC/P60 family cysteine hydrolase n=1 Tax=Haloferula chungangensis TaxID=1048331 RepID=A0ABW2LCR6_9BACT